MKLKEIKRKTHYIEEFDINVNDYLTYAEIQVIVNGIIKFNTWSERQTNIDMLVLNFATDIGAEKLQEIGHEALLESGLIDAVNNHIVNYTQIYEGIRYTESIVKALNDIVKLFPQYQKQIEAVMKDASKHKKR
nr:MAG TPA: hypothetical protein [Caudoviricetes sp.]